MKYLLITVFICSVFSTVNAQETIDKETNPYSKAVGGSLFMQFSSSENNTQSFLSKGAYIRTEPYFLIDLNKRLSLGALLSYQLRKNEVISTSEQQGFIQESTDHSYGIGIMNRVHLKQGRFQVFLQNQVRYSIKLENSISTRFSQEPSKTSQSLIYTEISPAIAYRFNRLRLMASLTGISYSVAGEEIDRDTNEILDRNSQVFAIDLSPRFLRIGAEFLF